MKHSLLIFGWVTSSLLTLSVTAATIHFLRQPRQISQQAIIHQPVSQPILAYKEQGGSVRGIMTSVTSKDARPLMIARFLERYSSPLKPYDYFGEFLVHTADKHGLDYRLLPSIAMQESGLCKKIPHGSFNCLGLGIHARGTWHFESFEANFDKAAEILKANYIDKGYVTPEQIQKKYTPSSNGSWQHAVNLFMRKIETQDF